MTLARQIGHDRRDSIIEEPRAEVLSTIPRNRICVTRRAVLGFHAPRWYDLQSGRTTRAPGATRAVTATYPAGVRAWIKKRGGLTQKVIYLRGKELSALYPRC